MQIFRWEDGGYLSEDAFDQDESLRMQWVQGEDVPRSLLPRGELRTVDDQFGEGIAPRPVSRHDEMA
jgi:hypothetical protein